MPTYEYACKECSEHLEVVQSFMDDALTECPSCGGSLRKVFSAAGIIFKGSGWHVKDYASSANRGPGRDAGSSGDGDKGKDVAAKETSSADSKAGVTTSSDSGSGSGSSEKAASGKAASGKAGSGKAGSSGTGSSSGTGASSATSSVSEKKTA